MNQLNILRLLRVRILLSLKSKSFFYPCPPPVNFFLSLLVPTILCIPYKSLPKLRYRRNIAGSQHQTLENVGKRKLVRLLRIQVTASRYTAKFVCRDTQLRIHLNSQCVYRVFELSERSMYMQIPYPPTDAKSSRQLPLHSRRCCQLAARLGNEEVLESSSPTISKVNC